MSKPLIVLEGPDGAGKSHLAERLGRLYDARVVHLGPFPRVTKGLARLYVEAMLPALNGYQGVVLDRSWLSEPIYGDVFRDGADRLGVVGRRLLDRVAAVCDARVVLCLPPLETCLQAFRARRGAEMLEREEQLERVWHQYRDGERSGVLTDLPVQVYDYTRDEVPVIFQTLNSRFHVSRHAGFLDAPVVLVGDTYGEVKDVDPLYQRPFVSFSRAGCSWWLTEKLHETGVRERDLLWLNADDPCLKQVIDLHPRQLVVALGQEADKALQRIAFATPPRYEVVEHPQSWKRFRHRQRYPLLDLLPKGGLVDAYA